MIKKLSCVSHGSLKRFPHTFTTPTQLLRLGAQSSYVVKYFEGSNAVKTTSMRK